MKCLRCDKEHLGGNDFCVTCKAELSAERLRIIDKQKTEVRLPRLKFKLVDQEVFAAHIVSELFEVMSSRSALEEAQECVDLAQRATTRAYNLCRKHGLSVEELNRIHANKHIARGNMR